MNRGSVGDGDLKLVKDLTYNCAPVGGSVVNQGVVQLAVLAAQDVGDFHAPPNVVSELQTSHRHGSDMVVEIAKTKCLDSGNASRSAGRCVVTAAMLDELEEDRVICLRVYTDGLFELIRELCV